MESYTAVAVRHSIDFFDTVNVICPNPSSQDYLYNSVWAIYGKRVHWNPLQFEFKESFNESHIQVTCGLPTRNGSELLHVATINISPGTNIYVYTGGNGNNKFYPARCDKFTIGPRTSLFDTLRTDTSVDRIVAYSTVLASFFAHFTHGVVNSRLLKYDCTERVRTLPDYVWREIASTTHHIVGNASSMYRPITAVHAARESKFFSNVGGGYDSFPILANKTDHIGQQLSEIIAIVKRDNDNESECCLTIKDTQQMNGLFPEQVSKNPSSPTEILTQQMSYALNTVIGYTLLKG